MSAEKVLHGDCLEVLQGFDDEVVNLVYLDPPFFTQKRHALVTRDGKRTFTFEDIWADNKEYVEFMYSRLVECKRVMAKNSSIFVHCDKNSVHLLRFVCDIIFGQENFRSEIIWYYKRWSNSSNSLLPAHQTILYYSKSSQYVFNKKYVSYSETTNVDQILQQRARDGRNKSVYARDNEGNVISAKEKIGVPLSDVWEIPYLNPKAKERVGYPTQKPVSLLERIIELSSIEGDLVLDPFCGSGTTLVAAKILRRDFVGIDKSKDAVDLALSRLSTLVRSESVLLEKGKAYYSTADARLKYVLNNLEYTPVSRNKGIDAILKQKKADRFVFVRLQKAGECVASGINALKNASAKRGGGHMIFVLFEQGDASDFSDTEDLSIVEADSYQISKLLT